MNPMRDINKHEIGCENKVGRATCGNTGIGGFVEVCSDCEKNGMLNIQMVFLILLKMITMTE